MFHVEKVMIGAEEGIAYGSLIDSHGIVWEVMTMQDN